MRGTCRRSGLTLLEILFAVGILASVSYYLFSSFIASTRMAAKTSSTLNESLLARTILERITDEVKTNPARISQLLQKHGDPAVIWGQVAQQKASLAAPDGKKILAQQECPFLNALFSAPAPEASAAPAPADQAKDPISKLQRGFGDFVARIQIKRQDAAEYGGGKVLAEMTTVATIEIYRISQRDKNWTPSFTLSTELLTPVESMSLAGAQEFGKQFPLFDAKEAKAQILAKLSANERYKNAPWDDSARSILTSMFVLYRNVRLEQFLTKGVWMGKPGAAPSGITTANSIEGLIQRGDGVLASTKSPRVRQQLADLCVLDGQTIMDAYKSSQMILDQDILAGDKALAQEIKDETSSSAFSTLRDDLASVQVAVNQDIPALLSKLTVAIDSKSVGLLVAKYTGALESLKKVRENYKASVQRRASLWLRTQLHQWFMKEPSFLVVREALKTYPKRFSWAVAKAADLNKEQLAQKGPTPLQLVFAAQDGVQLKEALALYDPSGTGKSAADFEASIRTVHAGFTALLDYGATLRPDDPIQQSLKDRFPLYAQMARDLAPLEESLTKQIEAHARDVDAPVEEIGKMAPTILRSAVQLKWLISIFGDAALQAALHVDDTQRNAISEAGTKSDPIAGDLVGDVGAAYTLNMVKLVKGDFVPAPDWITSITTATQSIKTRTTPSTGGSSGGSSTGANSGTTQSPQPDKTPSTQDSRSSGGQQ